MLLDPAFAKFDATGLTQVWGHGDTVANCALNRLDFTNGFLHHAGH